MGLFSNKVKTQEAKNAYGVSTDPHTYTWTNPGDRVSVEEHRGGTINLAKGKTISLTKTPKVILSCSWPPATDYDLYAMVQYRDGHVETVSAFGTKTNTNYSLVTKDRAVVHLGDITRSNAAMASETIEITMNPDIALVVPVVYSAQSNGTGSFHRYHVDMAIDNGAGQKVTISSNDASKDDTVYSCVPGVIRQSPTGVECIAVGMYSRPASENRPSIDHEGNVHMDQGETNAYK